MDPQKIEMIMKSAIPEEEKKKLINQLLGVKEKKKREYTPQQIEASKQRLQMARDAKKERAKLPKEPETQTFQQPQQTFDVKAIEDIFEKKYSSEMAKMGDLLLDLNKNIGEMAKIKKQKAEQKKLMEEEKKKIEAEKPKEEPKKDIPKEIPKPLPPGKIAFPNYRNIFGKK
jgi:hypothetical protein